MERLFSIEVVWRPSKRNKASSNCWQMVNRGCKRNQPQRKHLKEFLSKSVLIPSEETGLEVWGSEKGGAYRGKRKEGLSWVVVVTTKQRLTCLPPMRWKAQEVRRYLPQIFED